MSPRERILQRAIGLLATHGFSAMTMRQLAEAVGLDNSSLYRHFESKSVLVNAALDHVAAEALTSIAPHLDPSQPATLKALEDLCAAASGHFYDHPAAARLIVHWVMSTGERGPGFPISVPASDRSRPGGEAVTLVLDWMAAGVRNGELRRHAMPEALIILLGAILLRPATQGHLLASLEPKRPRQLAKAAWIQEVRATVRGAFAP
jgi:AcrR family transcriptional regulator